MTEGSVCEMLSLFLDKEGYEARFVHDGREALAERQREAYDLLILDGMLSGMDGIAVGHGVRSLHSSLYQSDGNGGMSPHGKARWDRGPGLFAKVLAGPLAVIPMTIVILSAILTFAVENLLYRRKVRGLRAIREPGSYRL